MNWDILNRLADADAVFQDALHHLFRCVAANSYVGSKVWGCEAAHRAHELMDRADDLDELERRDRDDCGYDQYQ